MLANIAAHGAQLHWVALKMQYCANIGRILSYRPIFIQYVNIVPIFSQYCLLVGYNDIIADKSQSTGMWANAQRDGRPAKYR